MAKKSKFEYSRKGYRTTYVNRTQGTRHNRGYHGLDTFGSTQVRRVPSPAWKLRSDQRAAWRGGE